MPHLRTSTVLATCFATVLLVASACSSGSEPTAEVGAAETTAEVGSAEPATEAEDSSTEASSSDAAESSGTGAFAISCDEASEALTTLRSSNGYLTATAAGNGDGLELDFEATLQAIETLRAIQDVDGIFGTPREGLDNVESDVVAASEGRITDMGGDYKFAGLNAVVLEEVCG